MEIWVTISGKVDLVQSNLLEVEISGGINLDLKDKWCWWNPPLISGTWLSIAEFLFSNQKPRVVCFSVDYS